MGYLELTILFLGSVGAALLLGTGVAYLRFRRSGAFPGQPEGADEAALAQAVRGAKVRMVFGATLTAAGVWALARVGVFG